MTEKREPRHFVLLLPGMVENLSFLSEENPCIRCSLKQTGDYLYLADAEYTDILKAKTGRDDLIFMEEDKNIYVTSDEKQTLMWYIPEKDHDPDETFVLSIPSVLNNIFNWEAGNQ